MKQYTPTNWKDRIVQFANRYKDQDGNTWTLTQDPGEVAQEGTLVEAEKMNNIEDGVSFLYSVRQFSYKKTLSVSGWTKNSDTGFYEYDIIDENITADTVVDGNCDIENQYKLDSSYTSSYDGGFKVITTEKPNEDIEITFIYSIMNKVDETEEEA